MIRVFSTYHYCGQSIHTVPENIVASCPLDSSHIILAKSNHIIEIHALGAITINRTDDFNKNHNLVVGCEPNYYGGDNVDDQPTENICFPTVDQVQQMQYCINGNYIITIESRTARRQSDKYFCRVYTNWHSIANANGYNASIRARIAGKVTPTNNSDCLEVIEIPVRGQPTQIACCQMTGNLVISIGNSIVFFKFLTCINDSTKYQYIDFKELPFAVDLEFTPTKLSLVEHCICAMNGDFLYLFKMILINGTESDDMISANSFTSDISPINNGQNCGNEESTVIGGLGKKSTITTTCIDFNDKRPDDWNVIISSTDVDIGNNSGGSNIPHGSPQSINGSGVEHKPVNIEMDCVLKRLPENGKDSLMDISCTNKEYAVKALLKIRQKDTRDPFKFIHMKPIYVDRGNNRGIQSTENADNTLRSAPSIEHIFKSSYCENFLGLAVLVATVNDGYLYQFTNNDKWITDDNNFVATYPFTSTAIGIAINDYVVQIVTDRGIETYTHRIGHKLFSNSYEYMMRDDQYPIETCPRIDETICLIGLRPFLGVRTMHCTNTNLILLANSCGGIGDTNSVGIDDFHYNNDDDDDDDDGNNSDINSRDTSWTIYNLQLPQPMILYHDFEELSKNYLRDSRSTYFHLMSEAHMIMRIAIEFYQIGQQYEQSLKAVLHKIHSLESQQVYLDSCRKLGDFCIASVNREEYCLAFPYYTMGKLTIVDVYERVNNILQQESDTNNSFIGLTHTLKNMLINASATEEMGRLLTGIRSHLDRNHSISFGEELIELFLTYAPNELSVLALRASVVRDYMNGKICDALNSKQDRTDVDKLCLILAHIANSSTKEVIDILHTFTESQLFIVLVEYWTVLFDSAHIKKTGKRVTIFSELTEAYLLSSINPIVRTCITNIFIYLMIDTKVISIDLLLKLLMDYLAAHVGQNGYVTGQLVLQDILESYYYDFYIVRGHTGTEHSDQSVVLESIITTTSSSDGGVAATSIKCSSNQHCHSNSNAISVRMDTVGGGGSSGLEHFFCDSIQNEAMKILIRIYLGKLKKIHCPTDNYNSLRLHSIPMDCRGELFTFMRQNLSKLFEHHQNYNANILLPNDNKNSDQLLSSLPPNHRRILFMEKRSTFLNSMHPLVQETVINNTKAGHINKKHAKPLINNINSSNEYVNEMQLVVIKFQALLCSGKLTRDIIQEIVYFFEANSPLIGLDSFICILLPMMICVDFLIDQHPKLLLTYGKSRIIFDKDWLEFLTRILDKKDVIIKRFTLQCYENILADILQHIVTTKRLVQVLKILPIKSDDISDPSGSSAASVDVAANGTSCDNSPDSHHHDDHKNSNDDDDELQTTQSDIDEEILFTQYLTMAIDRDRAERLGDMIKTTGHQLYETYTKNKQFFNSNDDLIENLIT